MKASADMRCPRCSGEIPREDVNVSEGAAYCRACNSVCRLRELVDAAGEEELVADVSSPPAGCSIEGDGVLTELRASGRSVGAFVASLFMAGFWNGVVSVFVLLALGSTLRHILGAAPAWLPGPFGGSAEPAMPLGMTLFLWLFLMPFMAIGLGLILAVAMSLAGRVEVRVRGQEGVVFIGIGPLGWKRRFDALAVRRVSLGQTTWKQNDQPKPVVVLETPERTIRFGSGLTGARREWLAAAVRAALLPRAGSGRV